MKIKAVLLDMGGVLLEMGNAVGFPQARLDFRGRQALVAWIQQRGGTVSLDDLDKVLFQPWHREYMLRYERGREASWDACLRALRRRCGLRSHTATLLGVWFRPYGEQLQPCKGAKDALRRLRRGGLRLAVVSNVPLPGKLYRAVLRRHRLDSAFESFHFSYDSGSRKPSPVMVREALSALGAAPHEAVMVGDRRGSDVMAGRLAGLTTVWIRSEDGGGPEADFTIPSLEELPGLLQSQQG